MDSRTFSILEAAIKEFIRTGKPASSAELYEDYDFGVKPAMIRSELSQLTKAGYLEQPHTSAGRVPTNKGYQFFADKALAENLKSLKRGLAMRHSIDEEIHSLISDVSEQLQLLSVGYQSEEKEVYKSGLDGLFEQLEFESHKDILEVIKDFEMLDNRVAGMKKSLRGNAPKVFIGKSPVTKSRHLSVVADVFKDKGNEFLLMVIGPTRMDYEKVIQFFKSLNN